MFWDVRMVFNTLLWFDNCFDLPLGWMSSAALRHSREYISLNLCLDYCQYYCKNINWVRFFMKWHQKVWWESYTFDNFNYGKLLWMLSFTIISYCARALQKRHVIKNTRFHSYYVFTYQKSHGGFSSSLLTVNCFKIIIQIQIQCKKRSSSHLLEMSKNLQEQQGWNL